MLNVTKWKTGGGREGNLVDKLEIGADLVVANIVAAVILRLISQLPLLNPGGRVILSGIIADRAGEVKDALLRNGLICQKKCRKRVLDGFTGRDGRCLGFLPRRFQRGEGPLHPGGRPPLFAWSAAWSRGHRPRRRRAGSIFRGRAGDRQPGRVEGRVVLRYREETEPGLKSIFTKAC